jgi:hypothetical protein
LFTRREDVFQQLVGDAAREAFGCSAKPMETQGQDGSIDIFIDSDVLASALSPALPGPIIVECKANDDTGAKAFDRVTRAWKEVEEKLQRKADLGWPDLFQPWAAARSYLYVTSAVLPHQVARQTLNDLISAFFAKLRREGHSKITHVHVADWTDLRSLLDQQIRTIDDWLGTGSSALMAHGDRMMSAATGFGRYLVEIPFVPPAESDPAHPDRLFEQIAARAQAGGVLLVGPGGIGKTRRLLEVASIAHQRGFRVLHAIHGDAPLKHEELSAEVLHEGGDVLVVCDYLDRLQLDFASVRRRILPDAERRGMRIAFLASARTDRELRRKAEDAAFFEVVELRSDPEHATRVVQKMRACLAPTATVALGIDKIDAIAGQRPIISLFAFLELERRASAGRLDERQLLDIRSGELSSWLRSRLTEDSLVVDVSPSALKAERVEPTLIAAAAVLAAAPGAEAALHDLALDVLQRVARNEARPPPRSTDAASIVEGLKDLGWLEDDGGRMSAVHDVVTDQILAESLRDARARLRDDVLEMILAPAADSPHFLGRLALAVRRLLTGGGAFERALQAGAERWFEGASAGIGRALEAAAPTDAAYAINAMFGGPPWIASALARWDETIEPWRRRHGHDQASWPAFFALLPRKDLPRNRAAGVTQSAMVWLGQHGGREEAATVLIPLLVRVDLDQDTESRATTIALLWHDKNHDNGLAGTVLGVLLDHHNLGESATSRVAQAVLSLFGDGNDARNAGFPLAMLVGRTDLAPQVLSNATDTAVAWFDKHSQTDDAGFVLAALIARADLAWSLGTEAVSIAFSWCEAHPNTLATGILLGALLGREDLPWAETQRVFASTWAWISTHRDAFEIIFPLRHVFGLDALTPEILSEATALALVWVEKYGDYPQTPVVLMSLLGRADLEPSIAARAADAALSWCKARRTDPASGVIVSVLLERTEKAPDLLEFALALLDADEGKGIAFAALSWALLAHGDIEAHIIERITLEAAVQIEQSPDDDEKAFLLAGLLSRRDSDKSIFARACDRAISWLEGRREDLGALMVLAALLRRSDLDENAAKATIGIALPWLELHNRSFFSILVLQFLLGREDLEPIDRLSAVTSSLGWLERNGRRQEALAVLQHLVRFLPQAPPTSRSILHASAIWLELHGLSVQDAVLLEGLLRRASFGTAEVRQFALAALAWLEQHRGESRAPSVVRALLTRRDLDEEVVVRAAGEVISWLEGSDRGEESVWILQELLLVPVRLGSAVGSLAPIITRIGLSWMAQHGVVELAALVLHSLLIRADLPREDVASTVRWAFVWLESHGDSEIASLVLQGLLFRTDLESENQVHIVRSAFSWFDGHGAGAGALNVVLGLIGRSGVGREGGETALRLVFEWLDRNVGNPEAGNVHALLLEHEQMDRRTARRAVRGALTWLSGNGARHEADGVLRWLFSRTEELTVKMATSVLHTMMRWLGIHGDKTPRPVVFSWIFIEKSASSRGRSNLRGILKVALMAFHQGERGKLLALIPELPALLALASRAGGVQLKRRVDALAVAALQARRLDPSAASELATACYRLVDAGAWRDAVEAEHSLVGLGIERSHQIPRQIEA